MIYLHRDFSDQSKQTLLNLVTQVESEKYSNFTDWVGDRWYDFESWIGALNIKNYINNVNSYHKKVIDKNNTTKEIIEQIFSAVKGVDSSYAKIFDNLRTNLSTREQYIASLSEIVAPGNGRFQAQYMASALTPLLSDIEQSEIDCLRDRMVQDINGELVFNEDLIYEYLKKSPAEMTDAEQALLLSIFAQLRETVVFYESLASYGDDTLGVDLANYSAWLSDSTAYGSFTAVSAHYNEIYVNFLNAIAEVSKDEATFASSLVTIGVDESVLSLLGTECSISLGDIFGTNSYDAYVAKYVSEHSEQYFHKLSIEESHKLTSKNDIDGAEKWAKDKLKENDLYREIKDTAYVDSDGNIISEKDAPTFYDREFTIAEEKKSVSASASLYEGSFDVGENGTIDVTIGKAEAHASVSAGLYVIGSDGQKKFSPGVNAEVGASVTAFEVDWDQQWLGDENLGLNTSVGVTAGKASAKADASMQIFGEDGKLNVQFGASASAEAIVAEAEGSVGVNILGGEVGVTGGVNFGLGAHADVGYRDGVFKCDIGASVGVGVSLDVEIDVGGMVDTVCDAAESVADWASSAWENTKNAWSSLWS